VLITLLAIWLIYVGFGSIALWAFRFAWVQLGAVGSLMSRALPLLMLTVVVFFTGELWQLAARMTRQRLWQVIGFLACARCWPVRRWPGASTRNPTALPCRGASSSTWSR
jgi:hypothetical protein